MGLMLITHDLAVVAGMADRIAIMKDGAWSRRADREIFGRCAIPTRAAVFGFRPCARARVESAEPGTTPVLGRSRMSSAITSSRAATCLSNRRRSAPSTM
jgi:peptide/nickel transport system ATP-binding protein